MKRILFSGDGSSGDLLPMVLMAREFKLAGYEVCVCGSSEFSKMAQDFDVPFEAYPHNYSELYLEQQKTGYVHNMLANIRHQEMLYQGEFDVLSKIAPQYDVLVNFLAEIFVPSIAEAFNMPNIKLYTFPVLPAGRYGPPAGLPFITENKWVNRLEWAGAVFSAKHLFSYNATVNRLRAELGLPPNNELLRNNARCDHLMIGLYEELQPRCPDWSKIDYSYIGPCLPTTKPALSDELEAFLTRGAKPIYIGFGSMRHQNSEELTRTLIGAARDVGVRVVLAQATSDIGRGLEESEDVYVLREYPIPHHVLFPRMKAAIHHGSWITTHLAAQAGIPQLVLPQASDQYLWSYMVAKNQLGPKGVDMNRLSSKKLCRAIEQLVSRPEYEANARALGERVSGIDGAKNALQVFERIKGKLQSRTSISLAGA
jgi:UDP:flavonoid glycosyltransferase YjiC (YdhE family)